MAEPAGNLIVVYQSVNLDVGTSRVLVQGSSDGGASFADPAVVADFLGTDEPDLRTGANIAGSVDPNTGSLYIAWQDGRFRTDGLNDIVLSDSSDGGLSWSDPRRVNGPDTHLSVDHFTPAIGALNGRVVACYRARTFNPEPSQFVAEICTSSPDAGHSWSKARRIGLRTDLAYAATLLRGTRFLGDYMGVAVTRTDSHSVWCRAARPTRPHARYHETVWAATIPT
jgi:hypothetical protein